MELSELTQLVQANRTTAPWMETALSYYGVAEDSSRNGYSNSQIIEFYESTTGRSYEIPFNRRRRQPSTLSSLGVICSVVDSNPTCIVTARYRVDDSSLAWCSAFINHVMIRSGYSGTHSLMARSWERWGRRIELQNPVFGAIAVFSRNEIDLRENNSVARHLGHVGFYVGNSGSSKILVLGGNQTGKVCIKPYPKNNSKYRLLTYRLPHATTPAQ
jgi:uncharacterized protein (TIGR02594 family)